MKHCSVPRNFLENVLSKEPLADDEHGLVLLFDSQLLSLGVDGLVVELIGRSLLLLVDPHLELTVGTIGILIVVSSFVTVLPSKDERVLELGRESALPRLDRLRRNIDGPVVIIIGTVLKVGNLRLVDFDIGLTIGPILRLVLTRAILLRRAIDRLGVSCRRDFGTRLESLDFLWRGGRVLDDVGREFVAEVDRRSSPTGLAVSDDVLGLGDGVDSLRVLARAAKDKLGRGNERNVD